jgi:hypothetical protein
LVGRIRYGEYVHTVVHCIFGWADEVGGNTGCKSVRSACAKSGQRRNGLEIEGHQIEGHHNDSVTAACRESFVPHATEFMSFPVKLGKEQRAEVWLQTLVDHQDECVATLDREAMHFESIFRAEIDGRLYLSWFSVQGTSGAHVASSAFPIDKVHMEFWAECIDTAVPPVKHAHVVNFVPPPITEAIEARARSLAGHAA